MIKFFFSDMSFGKWLRTKRKQAKMSQEVLAAKVTSLGWSVSGANISGIEREYDKTQEGKPTQPKETLVETIAIALDRPIDEARIKANYAPKDKNTLDILESVNFSVFNNKGIEEIKNIINAIRYLHPELLKTVEQLNQDRANAQIVGRAKFPDLADVDKLRHIPEEIATENAVGNKKKLLTGEEKVSNITEPYNDINPSPERKKIVMKKARYAAKQEPDVADEGEEAA